MDSKSYNVLGVMSGTSLDGLDIAHLQFTFQGGKISYLILAAETVPYSNEWVKRLKNAINLDKHALPLFDMEYTSLLAGYITSFIDEHVFDKPDAICSHGHTLMHRPQDGFTYQAGNLPSIAAQTGQRIVCDFRVQDVALGGQGAPLVPIGDRLLFSAYDFCLNLGGFSNISFEEKGERVAFDISPVNTVLNEYAGRMGAPYDDGGKFAASGECSHKLLSELNAVPFYSAPWPKSLGMEFVIAQIFPIIEKYGLPPQDVLATFTLHIAQQVAYCLKGRTGRMLVTGGGAYNTFLIGQMRKAMPAIEIVIPDDNTIQYKEALVFGLLGVLRLRGENNVLCSVTGAWSDHCAGFVYEP